MADSVKTKRRRCECGASWSTTYGCGDLYQHGKWADAQIAARPPVAPDRPLPRQLVPTQCGHCGRAITQPVEGRTKKFCDDQCRVNEWRSSRVFSHSCSRCKGRRVSLPEDPPAQRSGNETRRPKRDRQGVPVAPKCPGCKMPQGSGSIHRNGGCNSFRDGVEVVEWCGRCGWTR